MFEKEILLTAEKVCKVFTQEKGRVLAACKDISLQLYRGETLGLVGESGCGKSTFVRTIMGLHPATSGKILFKGRDINNIKTGGKWPGTSR